MGEPGGLRSRKVEAARHRDFQRRQLAVEDEEFVERSVFEAGVAESGAKSQFGCARIAPFTAMDKIASELVTDDLYRGGRAVQIDVDSRCAAAAVVTHRDVGPLAGGYQVVR